MTPDHSELKSSGTLVDYQEGSTWNDGGSWNTWIYELSGRFWRVHQPTNYHPTVEIDEVFRHETLSVTYKTKEK